MIAPLLFWETLGFHVVDWAAVGMAFWPRLILILLAIYAVFFVFRGSLDAGPFKSLNWRAYVLISGVLAYVLLWETLGFLVCTPIFMFLFGIAVGGTNRRCLVSSAVSAIVGTLVVYLVFNRLLYVQLPEGMFGVAL